MGPTYRKLFYSQWKLEKSFPLALARCPLKSYHCPSQSRAWSVTCQYHWNIDIYMIVIYISEDIECQFEIVFLLFAPHKTTTEKKDDGNNNNNKKNLFVTAITICRSFQFYKTFSTAWQFHTPAIRRQWENFALATHRSLSNRYSILSNNNPSASRQWRHTSTQIERMRKCWEIEGATNDDRWEMPQTLICDVIKMYECVFSERVLTQKPLDRFLLVLKWKKKGNLNWISVRFPTAIRLNKSTFPYLQSSRTRIGDLSTQQKSACWWEIIFFSHSKRKFEQISMGMCMLRISTTFPPNTIVFRLILQQNREKQRKTDLTQHPNWYKIRIPFVPISLGVKFVLFLFCVHSHRHKCRLRRCWRHENTTAGCCWCRYRRFQQQSFAAM